MSSTRPKTQPVHDGPSWEQAKRYEAYPTIKTRAGLPGVPRLAAVAAALVIGALSLFMLPGLLGVGGGGPGGSASPTPGASDAAASESPEPTVSAAPTPQTYTIKSGDTLNKIAKKFALTVDALLAANKQIKNPNKISVGDVLIDPVEDARRGDRPVGGDAERLAGSVGRRAAAPAARAASSAPLATLARC